MPTGRGVAVLVRRSRHVARGPDRRLARAWRCWASGSSRCRSSPRSSSDGDVNGSPFAAALRRPRRARDARHGPDRRREPLRPPTSFLLLEDRLPPALGRPARLVVAGIPAAAPSGLRTPSLPQVSRPLSAGAARRRRLRSVRADPAAAGVRRAGGLAGHPRDRGPAARPDSASGPSVGASRDAASCSAPARSTTRCASTRRATTCGGSTGRAWLGPAS